MRSSRNIPIQQHAQKKAAGRAFSIFVLLISIAFVVVSLTAGEWLNSNVVTPVITFFKGENASTPPPENTGSNNLLPSAPTVSGERQSENIRVDARTYYLLQGGIFSDLTNAAEASAEIKKLGGGGYVIDEGDKKRVILSAYLSEADAKAVRDRLKTDSDMETYVYANNLPEFSVSVGATSEQISIIKDAFALPVYTIDSLIKITEAYDRGSDESANMADLKAKAAEVKEKFVNSILPDDKNQSLLDVLSYISLLCDKISGLPSDLSSKSLDTSSKLKYSAMEIIDSYSQFIAKL